MRRRRTWLVFAAASVFVLGALAFVSLSLLKLEGDVSAQARREFATRQALWQMDSALAQLLAHENARALRSDWPAEGAFGPTLPFFDVYYTWQAGMPPVTVWAREGVGSITAPGDPAELIPESPLFEFAEMAIVDGGVNSNFDARNSRTWTGDDNRQSNDYNPRRLHASRTQQLAFNNGLAASVEPFHAVWIDEDSGSTLHLLRRQTIGELGTLQGLRVDWAALQQWLLDEVEWIAPGAGLQRSESPSTGETRLVSVPARLVLPDEFGRDGSSETMLPLAVTWICVLSALGVVAMALRASDSVSERRGRFVSAVTHELRTPLTTFQMYAQMLADGMVRDEDAKAEYLETLRNESERLSRVVESVLLYSRLEEGGDRVRRQEARARETVDGWLESLRQRAEDGGMRLEADVAVDGDATLTVDRQALEQVLLNLVDNACKYAAPTDDRLEVSARIERGELVLDVRDHGPGVPPAERNAIFQEFRRGEAHEAGAAPGVGVGLALARGLARAHDGDVTLVTTSPPGSLFRLTLPVRRQAFIP